MSSDFSKHNLIWDLPILWFTHGVLFERPWIGAEQGRWNYTKMWDTWCLAPAWAPRELWHINCAREFVLPEDKRVRLLNFWTPGNQNPLDGEQDGFNHWKVVTQRRLQIWTINWRTYSNWKISILTKLAKGTLGIRVTHMLQIHLIPTYLYTTDTSCSMYLQNLVGHNIWWPVSCSEMEERQYNIMDMIQCL